MIPISQRFIFFCLALGYLSQGCSHKKEALFKILTPDQTGVNFVNKINEDEYFNIINDEFIYNGAGIGIGDFNNDGLFDIYFCANMVSNKLYLNESNLKFVDISDIAGVQGDDRWSTGVTVGDIDNDGWQDIYVCVSYAANPEARRNILYINKGLNAEGIPVFRNEGGKYGIDDDGYSSGAAFFDYDNDNDLDLYVLTNVLDNPTPNKYHPKVTDGTAKTNDKLYRNNGNKTFTDVTKEAGITFEGYGLGISIVDFNKDGWKDIYITNDYLTNDLMYINNHDGTFTNEIKYHIKHQTHSAMGHDIADINNDGWPDIFTLDMLPANNQMLKRMHGASRWTNNVNNELYGYEYQYKRNMFQLNNGIDADGRYLFSELGFFDGITATDWSWSALLADFDNDGYRDLFVSNGYPRDVTDLDNATNNSRSMETSKGDKTQNIPPRFVDNFIFRNNGDMTFSDKSAEWGISIPSFSYGSVYVDLDNDGDLDIVSNNVNESAFIYENRLYSRDKKERRSHFIRMKIKSDKNGPNPFGTKIYLYHDKGKILYAEYSVNHGYASVTEPIVHFGLGKEIKIDSALILWPDGKEQQTGQLAADSVYDINYQNATDLQLPDPVKALIPSNESRLFKDVSRKINLEFKHLEEPFNDFEIQPTLPFQLSQMGPSIAVGDINNDGMEDIFIGGSLNHSGTIFIRISDEFEKRDLDVKGKKNQEDIGSLLFDADNDNDLDLYIVSGGFEQDVSSNAYNDRLYINDGKGNFTQSPESILLKNVSGSCVKAADFDKDGDLDLFIGGRVIPGKYPNPAGSFILENESVPGKIKFVDRTSVLCPELYRIGLVNDALWTDFNNDGLIDLIIAGEWMPVTFIRNEGNVFKNVTNDSGLSNDKGWWNSLVGGDFDNDGDIDYVVGNLGHNSLFRASVNEPVIAFGTDFDRNGTYDLVIGNYGPDIGGGRKLFPVHLRNDLINQIGFIKKRFLTYEDYGNAALTDLFTREEIDSAQKFTATFFSSILIKNNGHGKFEIVDLPGEVQYAPVFGMSTLDINSDGFLDLVLVGNNYGNNAFWGRTDAMNGLVLSGNGNGTFKVMNYPVSGFLVPGDAKALVTLAFDEGHALFIASQNQDSLKCFEINCKGKPIRLKTLDAYGIIKLKIGAIRKEEFYYGTSYLSQSARVINNTAEMDSVLIFDFKGDHRIEK